MFTVESGPLGEPSTQVNPQKFRLWNEDHRNTWEAGAISPRAEIPQARQNNHCKAKCGHSMHPSQAPCLPAEIHEFQEPRPCCGLCYCRLTTQEVPAQEEGQCENKIPRQFLLHRAGFRAWRQLKGTPGAAHRVPEDPPSSRSIRGSAATNSSKRANRLPQAPWKYTARCHVT